MVELKVLNGGRPRKKRDATKAVFIWSLVVGVALSGVAFAMKIAEFIHTITAEDAQGFADVPVAVYFFVAAGWLCLLVWCLMTGKFAEMEQTKIEMLEQEEAYERQGI